MPLALRALLEPHVFTAPVPPLCTSRPVTPRTTTPRPAHAHARSKLLHCVGVVEASAKKPRLNREGLSLAGRGYSMGRKSGRGQPSTFPLLRGLPIDVPTIDLSGESAPPVTPAEAEVEAETPAEAEAEAETPAPEQEAEDLRAMAMEMASVLAQIKGASPFVPPGPLAPVQAPSGPLATIEDVSDECGSEGGSEEGEELPCSSTWLPCAPHRAIAQSRGRPKLSSLKVDVSREPSKTHSPLVARADAVVALGRTLLTPLDVHLPSVPALTEMRASRRASYDALRRARREARESASHRVSLLKRLQVLG